MPTGRIAGLRDRDRAERMPHPHDADETITEQRLRAHFRSHGLPDDARLIDYQRGAKVDRTQVLQTTGASTAGGEGSSDTGRQLSATYDFPLNTHGSIGPSCAVAEFKDGRLTVWTPSQASHLLQKQLATMLGLAPENVRCIYVEGAGCYGRNGSDDCTSEAAFITVQIGRPAPSTISARIIWRRSGR